MALIKDKLRKNLGNWDILYSVHKSVTILIEHVKRKRGRPKLILYVLVAKDLISFDLPVDLVMNHTKWQKNIFVADL